MADLDTRNGGTFSHLNQNAVVQPLLTDLYQITMAYAYWKSNKCSDHAVFDLFFRKNPFNGEFTVFAGLGECLKFVQNFHYSESDIAYLRVTLPDNVEPEFFTFLSHLTAKDVTLHAVPEGSVVFPRVPLLRVEGPLPVVQLLETTLLTLVNYASLVATNAARYRMASGPNIRLLEFGLRRAQGPDGGLSASKYAYIGGFDATSNVLAGKLFNIPVKGTHAHAFIMSYSSFDDTSPKMLKHKTSGKEMNFIALCVDRQRELSTFLGVLGDEASAGELAAFVSYAVAFPNDFLALIDTYDVLSHRQWTLVLPDSGLSQLRIRSGLLNFCAVALALNDIGYKALGVRIDSGDLAYLSRVTRETFHRVAKEYNVPWFSTLTIIASNDINEDTVISLNEQVQTRSSDFLDVFLNSTCMTLAGIAASGHKIDCFGIGTHLVTCQKQPALGCVFKLVEVNNQSCIKLSLDVEKVTIPSTKTAYRLYGQDGFALVDLMQRIHEAPPEPGKRILCRHPFQESKRAYVIPSKVEQLECVWWQGGKLTEIPSLEEVRQRVQQSLETIRPDIKRNLNPTPYKVSVSDELYSFMHELWLQHAPIGELS